MRGFIEFMPAAAVVLQAEARHCRRHHREDTLCIAGAYNLIRLVYG